MFNAIISLLAGIGAFLMGFQFLSSNIEKLATGKLKKIFNKTSKSKVVGVGIGAVTTAVVQSSSAVTVMVVGFVNAGVMSLFQATTIIMGANIGTTITAQIVALQNFKITEIAMVLTLIGVFIRLIAKSDVKKTLGDALSGLGLVFLGLSYMSQAMDVFKENENILNAFTKINSPFLLLLLGIGITALFQSSSAVTTILISIASAGIVIGSGGNSILYVILGSNIGTCVTALLSSIGANKNAKRASLIHLMFNVFGTLIFVVLLLVWKDFMNMTFGKWFTQPGTQIAMFHTMFNIISTLIFIPFVSVFVRVAEAIIKDKNSSKDTEPHYLEERLLNTPAVALLHVKKETMRMSKVAVASLHAATKMFEERSLVNQSKVFEQIEEVNLMNKNIISYLVKLSTANLSYSDEIMVSSIHHILGDIIRISEISDNIIKYTNRIIKEDIVFSSEVVVSINEMITKIDDLYQLVVKYVEEKDEKDFVLISEYEEQIDVMRKTLIDNHIKRLNEGLCKAQSSSVFINLINNLERVGDHLNYIALTMKEEK